MQHVNDDMDDLFKRAAENYPLNTDGADWNAVAKKLSEQDEDKPAATGRNKNKYFLWLLLLLPLGGAYFYMTGKNEKAVPSANEIIVKENKKSANTQGNNSPANIVEETSQKAALSKNITLDVNTVKPAISTNHSLVLVKSNRLQGQRGGRLNSIITSTGSTVSSEKPSKVTDQKTELSGNTQSADIPGTMKKDISSNKYDNAINIVSDPKNGNMKQDSDNKKTMEKKTAALKKKNPNQKERGLYAGIVIGPDVSTVKFQSIKNIGVSMGVLVGYQINKKISIESGVSWDIKNYYSDGEYFDKSRVYPNPNTKIKSVEGVCNMIEVPVMVKYNLTTNKNNISISGGMSSYFMKKEDYDYIVTYNNGQPYPRSSSYKNSSTDLIAVANFSVGYNRQLKKGLALRIEPYLKIPVKGVGIGSLPIMSTGLNIGITKKLSR